ncbi:MAG: hypothetical protein M1839_003591 [Geoglossum umbratile]|nr:MAG: hypothetical protein M1839_003591 [Geoglossum umbratile]
MTATTINSDSQLMATETGQELDSPVSYEDDFSEDAVVFTPLEVDFGKIGRLASGDGDKDPIDPHSTCEEVRKTYAELISHARVRAALKRPIRLCKFRDAPACLMVLEIEFPETKQTREWPKFSRFKAVDVTVEFKDAAASPEPDLEVLMFCPEKYAGVPMQVTHVYATKVGGGFEALPSIAVKPYIGVERTHSRSFTTTSAVSIEGRTVRMGDKSTIIKWQLKEDKVRQQGVPKEVRLVMAIVNPGERAFQLKLNFSAYLSFGQIEFGVKKSKPAVAATVDPQALREQSLNGKLGPAFGQIWQCLADNADLETIDLRQLTNLEGSTVGLTWIPY